MKRSSVSRICISCLIAVMFFPLQTNADDTCNCCLADINKDCPINHIDLTIMAEQWLVNINHGLVGYWSFDEGEGPTAFDGSGNGNDGTIYGATHVNGVSGKALSLDGIDDFVDCGNAASLNPDDALTLAAWYRTVSFMGVGNNPIIDKGYTSHTSPFYQYHLGVTGDLYPPHIGYAAFMFQVEGMSVWTGSDFWTLDTWYFIAGTYDGSTIRLFVDGKPVSESPDSRVLADYGKNMYIGKFSNFDTYLPGIVDEVRIYNRALSQDEIRYLYNNPDCEGKVHADLNLDDIVNLKDFAILSSCWLGDNPDCDVLKTYLAGDIDDFHGGDPNDEITLAPKWADFFGNPPIDFDTFLANRRVVYTFDLSILPGQIESAELRVRVQSGSGNTAPLNDRIFLACLPIPDPLQALEDQVAWWRPFGTNNGYPDDDGLLAVEWKEGANHTFTFHLANVPTKDGGSEDLVLLLNSKPREQRCLDVIVGDDTAVDYIELVVTSTTTLLP